QSLWWDSATVRIPPATSVHPWVMTCAAHAAFAPRTLVRQIEDGPAIMTGAPEVVGRSAVDLA
ncbi:hypothetical protein, partial [Rhodococcus tibetensis]